GVAGHVDGPHVRADVGRAHEHVHGAVGLDRHPDREVGDGGPPLPVRGLEPAEVGVGVHRGSGLQPELAAGAPHESARDPRVPVVVDPRALAREQGALQQQFTLDVGGLVPGGAGVAVGGCHGGGVHGAGALLWRRWIGPAQGPATPARLAPGEGGAASTSGEAVLGGGTGGSAGGGWSGATGSTSYRRASGFSATSCRFGLNRSPMNPGGRPGPPTTPVPTPTHRTSSSSTRRATSGSKPYRFIEV